MAAGKQDSSNTQVDLSFLDVKLLAVTFLAKHKEGTEIASSKDRKFAEKITASYDDPDDNEKRRIALLAAERILGKRGDYERQKNHADAAG